MIRNLYIMTINPKKSQIFWINKITLQNEFILLQPFYFVLFFLGALLFDCRHFSFFSRHFIFFLLPFYYLTVAALVFFSRHFILLLLL